MKEYSIFTYTIIYVPTDEFKGRVPYAVAVVCDDKEKFLTRIDDYKETDNIKIGDIVYFKEYDKKGNIICSLNN